MKCQARVPQSQFSCGAVKGLLQPSSAGLAQPFEKKVALCFMLRMVRKDRVTLWPSLHTKAKGLLLLPRIALDQELREKMGLHLLRAECRDSLTTFISTPDI